jgi:hypothetical protein
MANTDVSLVAPSQNSFIDTLNQLTSGLAGTAQGLANAYSTFLGATATANLAKAQAAGTPYAPTQSELNAIAARRDKTISYVTYAGVAVAVLGTLALIYKAVK